MMCGLRSGLTPSDFVGGDAEPLFYGCFCGDSVDSEVRSDGVVDRFDFVVAGALPFALCYAPVYAFVEGDLDVGAVLVVDPVVDIVAEVAAPAGGDDGEGNKSADGGDGVVDVGGFPAGVGEDGEIEGAVLAFGGLEGEGGGLDAAAEAQHAQDGFWGGRDDVGQSLDFHMRSLDTFSVPVAAEVGVFGSGGTRM